MGTGKKSPLATVKPRFPSIPSLYSRTKPPPTPNSTLPPSLTSMAMAITSRGGNYLLPAKSSFQNHQPFPLSANPSNSIRFTQRISAVNSANPSPMNNHHPIVSSSDNDDKTLGFMSAAIVTMENHPIMTTINFWKIIL